MRVVLGPPEEEGAGGPVPEIRREALGEGGWAVGGADGAVTSLKPSCRTSRKFPRVRHASMVPAGAPRAGLQARRRRLLPLHTKTPGSARGDVSGVPHATYWKPRPEPN